MLLKELSDIDFKLFEQFKIFLEHSINIPNQLSNLHSDLEAIGIEYCIIGGLALSPHNYIRMTTDIDIIVSKKTLSNLTKLHGLGYTKRPGSDKNMYLHIMNSKIPIDVSVEGQVENNFILPNPKSFRKKINGIWYASLEGLIHLKLIASREQDISDIKILIKENELDINFYKSLPKETQELYLQLFKN
jgi:hypothetical protein